MYRFAISAALFLMAFPVGAILPTSTCRAQDLNVVLNQLNNRPASGVEIANKFLQSEKRTPFERSVTLDMLAKAFLRLSEPEKARKAIEESKRIALRLKQNKLLRKITQTESLVASDLDEHRWAVKAATESIQYSNKYKANDPFLAIPLNERGINHSMLGEFDLAIDDFRKALKHCDEKKHARLRLKVLLNLAATLDSVHAHEKSRDLYAQAIEQATRVNDYEAIAAANINIGINLLSNSQPEKALQFLEKGIAVAEEKRYAKLIAMGRRSVAEILVAQKEYEQALDEFELAIRANKDLGNQRLVRRLKKDKEEVELLLSDDIESWNQRIAELHQLLAQSEAEAHPIETVRILNQLLTCYEHTNDANMLSQTANRLFEAQKQIQQKEIKEAIQELERDTEIVRLNHALEKKNVELLEGQRDLALTNLELANRKQGQLILGSIGFLLFCVAIFLGVVWSQKKKSVAKLEKANAEIRREQQRLLVLEKQLAQQEKIESLSAMSAGVVHDFNNYLAAIVGGAEVGQVYPDKRAKNEQFETIINTALHASELTKQLSNFMGIGAKSNYYCDVVDTIRSIDETLIELAGPGIQLKFRFEGRGFVMIDPAHVKQILTNLVLNSKESMEGQDGKRVIEIRNSIHHKSSERNTEDNRKAETSNSECRLTISDTGKGMSPEEIQKATDPFYSTKSVGRGLGLASVSGIVKANDGELILESTPGQGTKIQITLPCIKPPREKSNSSPLGQEPSSNDETTPTSQLTVLFVEDDEMVREHFAQLLESSNFTILSATSAWEAKDVFRKHHHEIDVVLTDFEMPEMNGADLARAIRKIKAQIPIVLVSGFQKSVVYDEVLFDAFVPKPFLIRDLIETVNRVRPRLRLMTS